MVIRGMCLYLQFLTYMIKYQFFSQNLKLLEIVSSGIRQSLTCFLQLSISHFIELVYTWLFLSQLLFKFANIFFEFLFFLRLTFILAQAHSLVVHSSRVIVVNLNLFLSETALIFPRLSWIVCLPLSALLIDCSLASFVYCLGSMCCRSCSCCSVGDLYLFFVT